MGVWRLLSHSVFAALLVHNLVKFPFFFFLYLQIIRRPCLPTKDNFLFGDFGGNNQSLDEDFFFILSQERLLAMELVTDTRSPHS